MDFQTIFNTACGAIIAAYGLYKGIAEIREHTEAGKQRRSEQEKKAEQKWAEQVNEIVSSIVKPIQDSVLKQETQINTIEKITLLNQESQMDLMRAKMNSIYYKYLPFKKILDYDRKAFLKLFEDYRAQNGNTWILDLHDQLIEWEVVTEEEDLYK